MMGKPEQCLPVIGTGRSFWKRVDKLWKGRKQSTRRETSEKWTQSPRKGGDLLGQKKTLWSFKSKQESVKANSE